MRRVNTSLSTPTSPFTSSSSAASRKDSIETVNGSKTRTGAGTNSENTQVDQTVQSYWQRRMIAAGAELLRSTKAITPELLRSSKGSSKGTLNRSTEQNSSAAREAVNSSRAAELLNIQVNNMSYWQRRMIAAGAELLNRTKVSTGTVNSSAAFLNRRQAVKPVLSYNGGKVRGVRGTTTLGSTSGFSAVLSPAFQLETADMLKNEQEEGQEEQEQEEDEGLSKAKAVKEVAAEREEGKKKGAQRQREAGAGGGGGGGTAGEWSSYVGSAERGGSGGGRGKRGDGDVRGGREGGDGGGEEKSA